jgi:DNA (cytosine-5)-methyltransferase 1
MKPASVVDLFCGIGGLTHGFVKEGFNVVAGIDDDETCKYAYEKNNRAAFIKKDIEEVTADEIIRLYPKRHLRILVGCAPCQPFSRYTIGKDKDEKWKLLRSFAKLIKGVQAEVVSMENVPELKGHEVYEEFKAALEEEKYFVSPYMVYCPDYGVPQTRKRLVLFASKFGAITIVEPTHKPENYRTVRDAIGHLEQIEAGQVSDEDPLHRARKLSDLNLKRIESTPPGGSWKDWDDDLVLDCHKAETGRTYPSIYGRMKWDEPAPTMTTHCGGLGNGRFGHPEQHRAISMREAALFQTFPKSYKFIEPGVDMGNKTLSRHIGNAVPVRLGRIIARSIKRHLEKYCEKGE